MLCQKCKKNPANVYYKKNINGHVTEIAMCSECAAKSGLDLNAGFSIADPFEDGLNLLGSFFGMPARHTASLTRGKTCPLCGSTLADISESGMVGCSECYKTFGEELAPSIAKIHGRTRHAGRGPKEFKAKQEKENKLASLKQKLDEAVGRQEFEEAAKLRDEIKRISSEG